MSKDHDYKQENARQGQQHRRYNNFYTVLVREGWVDLQ